VSQIFEGLSVAYTHEKNKQVCLFNTKFNVILPNISFYYVRNFADDNHMESKNVESRHSLKLGFVHKAN